MPRANRFYQTGYVWHITHRCHQREFLLKFTRDRRRWLYWLFEARKRFDLCVLNYIVTSNHIHLLVYDRGRGEISDSMQLVAARTAQEYNLRKGRQGAFWEDRYHATAVDADEYLARCLVYIDLNMVRAGVVSQAEQWPESGYRELQSPPQRYRIVDESKLMALLAIPDREQFRQTRCRWLDAALVGKALVDKASQREAGWSDSLAVGSERFIADFKTRHGVNAIHRSISGDVVEGYELRESKVSYSPAFGVKMGPLRP